MISYEGWVVGCGAGVFGAAVGSFCATAALRFAAGGSPWGGRSHCDGCARSLSWAETLPFVGYIRSGGSCSACQHPIDRLHLWGEGLGAAVAATALVLAPDLSGIVLALVGLVLLGQALIDLRTHRLPDIGNAIVAGLCGLVALAHHELLVGLVAAAAAFILLIALKIFLERRRGRTMLGAGDVKLIAALALGLGAWTPYMIAAAAVLGLIVIFLRRMKGEDHLPFGPFIAASGFVLLLAGSFIGAPL